MICTICGNETKQEIAINLEAPSVFKQLSVGKDLASFGFSEQIIKASRAELNETFKRMNQN